MAEPTFNPCACLPGGRGCRLGQRRARLQKEQCCAYFCWSCQGVVSRSTVWLPGHSLILARWLVKLNCHRFSSDNILNTCWCLVQMVEFKVFAQLFWVIITEYIAATEQCINLNFSFQEEVVSVCDQPKQKHQLWVKSEIISSVHLRYLQSLQCRLHMLKVWSVCQNKV